MLVTAAVDKMVLKKSLSVAIDLKIGGAVIWVGRSSIEIQLEVTQPSDGIYLELTVFRKMQQSFKHLYFTLYRTCFHDYYDSLN